MASERNRWADYYWWGLLVAATAVAGFLRLWNLPATLEFWADQGRDALVAWGVTRGDWALVGPSTSVGSMFLGPLYYYFMVPSLVLARFNPLGPAYAVAILGTASVPILGWLVGKWHDRRSGLLAAWLFAFFPPAIEFTRFSWNPNPAPIVMLGSLYCLWRAWRGKVIWWLGVALGMAILLQLHYVAAASAGVWLLWWLTDFWRSNPHRRWQLALAAAGSALILAFSFIPLVLFNWRFDNQIVRGFTDFATADSPNLAAPLTWADRFRWVRELEGRALFLFFELWGGFDWTPYYRQINQALLYTLTGLVALSTYLAWKDKKNRFGHALWWTIALTTVGATAFYKGEVYPHYVSFAYILVPWGLALALRPLWKIEKSFGLLITILLTMYLAWLGMQPDTFAFLKSKPWQIKDMQRIAREIEAFVPPNSSYALTGLSEIRDYRALNYRYFLAIGPRPPASLEKHTDADYLVVIAEDPRDPDDVINSPVYEIAAYPKGDWESRETNGGPRLYLIHRATE